MPDSRDNWESHWERYAGSASANPAQSMRHDFIARLLQRHAEKTMRVFDIGSGQGDMLKKINMLFPQAELLGVELSNSGVEISRRKVPRATCITADLFESPSDLLRFRSWATHAVCSEVLEHLDAPLDFLKLSQAYLATGAKLIITVPGGPMSAFDRHIGHRQHFTKRMLAGMLCEAGYKVERIYRAGFPFFNIYRGVVIARGEKLSEDVHRTSFPASFAMAMFRMLFHFNLSDSPFGWQLIAVAQKT
jgi:cyclopropane fatty-acyl-phospholipid synthase-like methyltransferase